MLTQFIVLLASPPGIEPGSSAPEANVLSVILQGHNAETITKLRTQYIIKEIICKTINAVNKANYKK